MSIEIFSGRHLSAFLSIIGVHPPRPRPQASQTASSGGSARKPAPAPHPPDDAVGTAWASTRSRSEGEIDCTIRCAIRYQRSMPDGRPFRILPGKRWITPEESPPRGVARVVLRPNTDSASCAAAGWTGTYEGGRPDDPAAPPRVCPAWAGARRCKSSGELVVATRANGKVLSREDSTERSR
jgi:hypothetical protein